MHEAGLEALLGQVHIRTTTQFHHVVHAEVIFICVGTPLSSDGSMSLESIAKASEEIARVLGQRNDYCVVAVKSTVVPGTTEELVIPILETSKRKAGVDFGVCMTPEFLREGMAVYDYMNPARIVIGEYDRRSGETLLGLCTNFNAPVVRTNLRTAEIIKVACNSFLGTKISFINEIGNICKMLGADTRQVAEAMGLDERIGNKFLNPGIGFGGSCISKDISGLVAKARQMGYRPHLLESVLKVNDEQPIRVVELLKKHISLKGTDIGILGLAFKPGTDDVRDSRAARIVEILLHEGARIKAYDPLAVPNFRGLFPNIGFVGKDEVLKCDAIVIATEWEEFEYLDYRGKIVIDGRGIAKAREARIYEGVCW